MDLRALVAAGAAVLDFETIEFAPVNLSTYKRLNNRIAFISENWLFLQPADYYRVDMNAPIPQTECGPNGEPCYEQVREQDWGDISTRFWLNSLGVRFISEKFTTDVALINLFADGDYLPLPWLDVSWYFGETN